jgi:hypothetical protein
MRIVETLVFEETDVVYTVKKQFKAFEGETDFLDEEFDRIFQIGEQLAVESDDSNTEKCLIASDQYIVCISNEKLEEYLEKN